MLRPGEPSTISPEREAERLRLSEDERVMTDAATAQTGLASARAAVARAHAQSLINGAALAFAAGSLTSSADFSRAAPR